MTYSVAIAGTTLYTRLCATAIIAHPQLQISFIITPTAKPTGRRQVLTPNPLQNLADSHQIPTVLVKNKIDESIKNQISTYDKPDFLLVVDFGYLVPDWLLSLPRVMPLNIHPSALPQWRGSSPGQFVLLSGAKTSAVTIIQMTAGFDQGPIVWQKEFAVGLNWTQTEYYQHSFQLATKNLAEVILLLANQKITLTPQPITSPTPLAQKITKADAFVTWEKIKFALTIDKKSATQLERACRAYSPWPVMWTKVKTNQGLKRMQLVKTKLNSDGLLSLDQVKIEGMTTKPWTEIKNKIID